jgi:hypothetical protein
MPNLDSAEEGGAGDLLVVKEDLYLVGDGLLGGEGDQALSPTQHLQDEDGGKGCSPASPLRPEIPV